ncbi:hypothetical protein SAY87_007203 [Trapa incisa]|uniref:Uncharacterized protein n=1 Tax=Trapa incisa TaxID=236973 RepID=A0AAN7JZV5_9MYRT|nr:hypothetical protein SAY87_007203 [Trapa incisa]
MSTTTSHSVLIVQSSLYQNLNCINGDFIDSSAMPGLAIMENSCTSLEVPVGEVNFLPFPKERFNHQISSRSPLSPDTPRSVSIDLAVHGATVNISIEQLYNNVCEMQSSEHSPSAPSFLSYGEESRIDSELCHIIGCFGDAEMITKNAILTENEEGSNNSTVSNISADDFPKKKDIQFIKEKTPKASNSIPKSKKRPTNLKPPRKQKTMISPVTSTKLQKASEASGGKFKESKSHCGSALKIYDRLKPGIQSEEVAIGLVEISVIYQSMDEFEPALKLLKRALRIYGNAPRQRSMVAGLEAQVGVMYYMTGNFSHSYAALNAAVSKFRASSEKKSALLGITLNQLGLACVQRYAINEAADLFEEAREILEIEYGPYHPDTLGVYSNLAGTYDAMGRVDDALDILEYVVRMREERLGTANPHVDDEKRRLEELLKETGRVRSRNSGDMNINGEIIAVEHRGVDEVFIM